MGTTAIGKYIAGQTLELKSQTQLISFYSLIWNGSYLMVAWDTVWNDVIDCYGINASELDVDDIHDLHEIIAHHHSLYLEEDNE